MLNVISESLSSAGYRRRAVVKPRGNGVAMCSALPFQTREWFLEYDKESCASRSAMPQRTAANLETVSSTAEYRLPAESSPRSPASPYPWIRHGYTP